jgi:ribosomal-protein-alanine acetyltransferase
MDTRIMATGGVRVRKANVDDIPAIMELERQSATAAHWSRSQYETIFTGVVGTHSRRFAWVAEGWVAEEWVGEEWIAEGRIAEDQGAKDPAAASSSGASQLSGFLVANRVGKEWALENIVVAGKSRRRGVGILLVSELIHFARGELADRISLEVRESNQSARALYGKTGFQEHGLRRGYYSNPPEDAILYLLRL